MTSGRYLANGNWYWAQVYLLSAMGCAERCDLRPSHLPAAICSGICGRRRRSGVTRGALHGRRVSDGGVSGQGCREQT